MSQGVRYQLPASPLRPLRLLGLVLSGLGLVPLGMGGGFLYGLAINGFFQVFFRDFGLGAVCFGFFLLFPVGFVSLGLFLVWYGIWILAGHTEVELTTSHLR